jgi:hypothetical protein
MSEVSPWLRLARATVFLTSGRSATQRCDSHKGVFNQPFTEGELRGKFRELTGRMLLTKGTGLVEQAIDRSADWQTVDALTTLCRRHGCEQ